MPWVHVKVDPFLQGSQREERSRWGGQILGLGEAMNRFVRRAQRAEPITFLSCLRPATHLTDQRNPGETTFARQFTADLLNAQHGGQEHLKQEDRQLSSPQTHGRFRTLQIADCRRTLNLTPFGGLCAYQDREAAVRGDELLVLNYAGFSRHVRSLFWKMRDSRAYAELFIRDPAGVISKKVFPGYPQPMPGTLNQANRILFSLLSNARFMEFTRSLQEDLEARARELAETEGIEDFGEALRLYSTRLNRTELYGRLADGISESIDREMLFALTLKDPHSYPVPDGGDGGTWCPEIPQPGGNLPDLCPDPTPNPHPNPMDTVAYHEVAIVTIAVAVAFVVVTVIDFTPKPVPLGLSREDILAVTRHVTEQFQRRVAEVRESGVLLDPAAITKGPVL